MILYVDGSCKNNQKKQNKGGFGVIAVREEKPIYAYSEFSENTTNNREELKAIIYAVEFFNSKRFKNNWEVKNELNKFVKDNIKDYTTYRKNEQHLFELMEQASADIHFEKSLTVFTDSAYCVNTLTDWMFSWQSRGWIKADKKTPENLDLIKKYYKEYHILNQNSYIDIVKVKGHSNNIWNILADQLATGAISPEEVMNIYG